MFYFHSAEYSEIADENVLTDDELTVAAVGTYVVTFACGNFCRGRILPSLPGETDVKIELIDFGVTKNRPKGKIYKLRDKWSQRQAAAYPGKLTDSSEYQNAAEKFRDKVKNRLVAAEIISIHNKVVVVHVIDI